MTDSTKKLQDLLKDSGLAQVSDSASIKRMLELARAPQMAFDIPRNLLEIPRLPPMPTQKEVNSYQSAGVLVKRMAQTVTEWRKQIKEDSQPSIIAILHGGAQVSVSLLAEESFHTIRIEGTIDGNPCMILTHQSSVQLLCFVSKIESEDSRRKIGFVIDGQEKQL